MPIFTESLFFLIIHKAISPQYTGTLLNATPLSVAQPILPGGVNVSKLRC